MSYWTGYRKAAERNDRARADAFGVMGYVFDVVGAWEMGEDKGKGPRASGPVKEVWGCIQVEIMGRIVIGVTDTSA